MQNLLKKLNFITNSIAATLLVAIFFTFLLQIFSRYFLLDPFGWTLELCLTLWIWLVFFGNIFIVRERDHVIFNLLIESSPRKIQRIMALISAACIVIITAWAFLPTWEYVDWMAIRKSAVLRIPLRTVFSIYIIFMIFLMLRYAYRFYDIYKNGYPRGDK